MNVFAEIIRRDTLTLEQLKPQRIVAAYRIVRLLASLQGLVISAEPLAAGPVDWSTPRQGANGVSPQRDLGGSMYRLRLLLEDNPTPLLPPSQPDPLPPIYQPADPRKLPHHDPPLYHYMNVVNGAISVLVPPYDALKGLTHAHHVREAFPTRREILEFEEILLFRTLRSYTNRGLFSTIGMLASKYRLQRPECLDLIEQAKTLAAAITPTNTDQERALLKIQLDDYIRRSKKSFDLAREMQALKLKAMVTGVTRDEPTNPFSEFTKAVRELSDERKSNKAIEQDVSKNANLLEEGQ